MEIRYRGLAREGGVYDIYRCPHCGLGKTHPFPERALLEKLYAPTEYRSHDRRFIPPVELLVKHFRKARLRGMKAAGAAGTGRMLDIGCGRGMALQMAREEGWEVYGLEFNEDTAHYPRDVLGMDVRTGGVEDAGFEENSFDVISLWHVLEHLEDPVRTVDACFSLLRPGGLLVLAIPNFDSFQSRLGGGDWFHLDVPFHLYHFSSSSLRSLLERNAFRIVRTSHFSLEQNPFGFLQTMLNRMGLKRNLLYDTLKSRSLAAGREGSRRPLQLAATLLSLPLLAPVAFGASVAEAAAGAGGTIEVYAGKEAR